MFRKIKIPNKYTKKHTRNYTTYKQIPKNTKHYQTIHKHNAKKYQNIQNTYKQNTTKQNKTKQQNNNKKNPNKYTHTKTTQHNTQTKYKKYENMCKKN